MVPTDALLMTMSALETGRALASAGARVNQIATILVQQAAMLMRHKTKKENTNAKCTKNAAVIEPAQIGDGAKVTITAKTISSQLIHAKSMRLKMRKGHTSVRSMAIAEAREPAQSTAGAKVRINAMSHQRQRQRQLNHAKSTKPKIRVGHTSARLMTNAKAKESAHNGAGVLVKIFAISIRAR